MVASNFDQNKSCFAGSSHQSFYLDRCYNLANMANRRLLGAKRLKLRNLRLVLMLSYALFFTTSYTRYTSIGLDFSVGTSAEIYIRIRWPGNGSFWLGGGNYPIETQSIYLDLAATFFQPAQAEPKTVWQRAGFWFINETNLDSGQHFIGIPSYLPLLVMLFMLRYQHNETTLC